MKLEDFGALIKANELFDHVAWGSAQETRGRYGRMKHWLPEKQILERQALCDEIIAILSTTIKTLRSKS